MKQSVAPAVSGAQGVSKKMIIVTSGGKYTDIDAYGGCVAYAELLRQGGEEAEAVLEPPLNASVTPHLRSLPVKYSQRYQPVDADMFVLVDISEERVFAPFVTRGRISEIIDHHPGFEAFWAAQEHVKAQIEVVGAACTQIFERWEGSGKTAELSQPLAQLLMAGILDNTLYFKATITTDRDRVSYEKLQAVVSDDGTFAERYFEDCQTSTEKDIASAVINDMKHISFPQIGLMTTGQLAVWDADQILHDHTKELLKTTMAEGNEHWFMNVIDIRRGKSTILTTDKETQAYFSSLLGVTFNSAGLAQADRLWLRKEMMKAAIAEHGEIA